MNNKLILFGFIFGVFFVIGYLILGSYEMVQDNKQQSTSEQSPSPVMQTGLASDTSCDGQAIPSLTEGPYYTPNSPEKTNFQEEGIPGEKVTLTGYVFDTDCTPIANAWLDFWQADGSGEYDNSGYKLRGHQYTDSEGRYTLQTVIPGEYPGRTPHIHFKIKASEGSPVITSQLFLQGAAQNQSDPIFSESLVINIKEGEGGKESSYNIVVSR